VFVDECSTILLGIGYGLWDITLSALVNYSDKASGFLIRIVAYG